MNRDEMIEEIKKKKECHLVEIVKDLVSRAITEEEKILGKYLKHEVVEVKERGTKTVKYNYYIVTDRKFIKIFASETEYWYKLCLLNSFMGLEENNLPAEGGIGEMDFFAKAGFPGKMQVNIYFDVIDEGLRQVALESKEDNEKREADKKEIKKFVTTLVSVVSGLHNK